MSDEKRVDALSVMDAHAGGIEEAIKSARGASRSDIVAGLAEFLEARTAVAELIDVVHEAQRLTRLALSERAIKGSLRSHFTGLSHRITNALSNLGAKP